MQIIKCSNNRVCEVSATKWNNKNVVKLDFNVKSYEQLEFGKGWKEVFYPKEVLPSIQDKLFIVHDDVHNVIEVLDTFINTYDINLPNTTQTNRGFAIVNLKDAVGNEISIQKSSAASIDKIWFGAQVNEHDIGHKKDGKFIRYQYVDNHEVCVHDRLHLTIEQVQQLRMAMLNEMVINLNTFEAANLAEKNTPTTNNMINDMWGNLSGNLQKIMFMCACDKGNLDLVKIIYKHPENKFLKGIFCSFEEYGLQMSLQPESKKVLKFFKDMMKEKDMQLSQSMVKWVQNNKLGRKIKIA